MKKTLLVVSLLSLSGCAGFGQIESVSTLSPQQLQNLSTLSISKTTPKRSYASLGTVKGLSCVGSAISGTAKEEAAMTQMKIKAIKLEADAVLYPTCAHDASVDWGNNCWESWVCAGEAIQFN